MCNLNMKKAEPKVKKAPAKKTTKAGAKTKEW